jgi:hypothetical protein
MGTVRWSPADQAPPDAAELERQIEAVAPSAQVQMTLRGEVWRVRALGPPTSCGRGRGFDERDLSAAVAELLRDAGISATA